MKSHWVQYYATYFIPPPNIIYSRSTNADKYRSVIFIREPCTMPSSGWIRCSLSVPCFSLEALAVNPGRHVMGLPSHHDRQRPDLPPSARQVSLLYGQYYNHREHLCCYTFVQNTDFRYQVCLSCDNHLSVSLCALDPPTSPVHGREAVPAASSLRCCFLLTATQTLYALQREKRFLGCNAEFPSAEMEPTVLQTTLSNVPPRNGNPDVRYSFDTV